jgi:hypothetical protein
MANPIDGYELYRLLHTGSPLTLQVKNSTYTLQFEGVKTGAHNWLKVTDPKGESIRLSMGWSTEACWNALRTLEAGRWANPIGKWRDPSEWSEPKDCP